MAEPRFSATHLPGFAAVAVAAFVVLYLPILTLVAYSFNDTMSISVWGGFSLRWYEAAWENRAVQEAYLGTTHA